MAMSVTYTNFCGIVIHENRGGTERDYMQDPLGSTAALLDNTQTKTDTWEYWPYGEVSARTGTNPTPLTFVGLLGYFKDILDKLFYVRARHLKPDLGRWLTVDPLWPHERAYEFVRSNPAVFVDTTGLQDSVRDWLNNVFPPRQCQEKGQAMINKILTGWWPWPCLQITTREQAIDCSAELIARLDRTGIVNLFVKFKYGDCCGLKKRCNAGEGKDCVDKACAVHDDCLGQVSTFFDTREQCACDAALCRSLQHCGCKNATNVYLCEQARARMITFYCEVLPRLLNCT